MSSHLAFLSASNPRNLDKSRHFTVHLLRPWRPGSARGKGGGPRRFTEVIPTPHAYSGQRPVKTKRARARSCASVVTRKRPSLNRARNPTWPKPPGQPDRPQPGREGTAKSTPRPLRTADCKCGLLERQSLARKTGRGIMELGGFDHPFVGDRRRVQAVSDSG